MHCELKTASTANSLILGFPGYSDLLTEMVALVKEEMSHFKMVHERLLKKDIVGFGWKSQVSAKDYHCYGEEVAKNGTIYWNL